MTNANYKDVLLQTISETYPKYYQRRIIKQLEHDGLVYYDDQFKMDENAVDLTGIEEDDILKHCVENSDKVIRKIEEAEFTKSYDYSVIFSINNFAKISLDLLQSRGLIIDFKDENFKNDQLIYDKENIIPTQYTIDDNITIVKFSRLLKGYLPIENNNKREIKYTILAIIYKDINIMELRFEKVRGFLKNNDEYFYIKQIELIKEWFEDNIGCTFEEIDLSPVIEYISRFKSEEVYVSAQAMNLKSKKKAVLDTGDNDEDVLPLLGELKELIKVNKELFDKNDDTKEIKELLETFILETENSSDLPWISLTWKNEAKSKATKVKFSFNYMNKGISLLQYYGNKTEMERMNNVTRYLIENKRAVDEEELTSDQDSHSPKN